MKWFTGLLAVAGIAAGTPPVTAGEAESAEVSASSATPATPAADADEHSHDFDFWLGEWEVFDSDGKRLGHNRIEAVNKGRTLAEHWKNERGGEGRSYNTYDVVLGRWFQFWSDDKGETLWLSGGLRDGAMVMSGERPRAADGRPQLQRISWIPAADGSVRQLWETSDDAGVSWQVAFDGRYRRSP